MWQTKIYDTYGSYRKWKIEITFSNIQKFSPYMVTAVGKLAIS